MTRSSTSTPNREYRTGALLAKGPWLVDTCTDATVTQKRELYYAQTVSYDGGTTWEQAENFVAYETKLFKRTKNSACPA